MAQGDPQVVGVPVFAVTSIALAFQLVRFDGTGGGSLGAPLALVFMGSGLFLLLSMLWAAALGQSFVASVFGTFGSFWLSYGFFVVGLVHNWWPIQPADVTRAVAVFSIAWASFFLVQAVASLRLPAIYPAIIFCVVVALCLLAAAYMYTPVDLGLVKAAGIFAFIFGGLGLSVSWTTLNLSVGGPAFPPLGPVLIKAKS